MRIACVGNTNNMLFSMARYLRQQGWSADLLLQNNELPQFQPLADTFDFVYRTFTRTLTWGDKESFARVDASRVVEDVSGYDFVIGINTVPAFFAKANITLDLFIPAGNDLYKLPRLDRQMRWDQRLRQPEAVAFFKAQRRGIQSTWIVNHDDADQDYSRVLRELDLSQSTYFFGFPMVFQPIYSVASVAANYCRSAWYREFLALRESADFLVFNGNQQFWTIDYDPDTSLDGRHKGTDRLIRGFALFRKRHPSLRARLIQFEYGPDVLASKRLCEELGIADSVAWFPTLPRKELMVALSLSDCGCGQFFAGCSGGGTTWEVLAAGKPLLHYRHPGYRKPARFTSWFPHFNVGTDVEIADALECIKTDPDSATRLGMAGAAWYEENLVRRPLDEIAEMCKLKQSGGDKRAWRDARVRRFSMLDQSGDGQEQ